jgi:hypothetical protein
MKRQDYDKVWKAKAAVEAIVGRKINSLSEAVGLMADYWYKVYVKMLSKEMEEIPELLKASEHPAIKKLAEEWVK